MEVSCCIANRSHPSFTATACMQGAVATHPVDGDLTIHLDACAPGHRFASRGLSACSLDTNVLGNHTVSFFLSDALVPSSDSATRTLVVHAACPSEEVLCADNSCSTSGFCFASTPSARAENAAPSLQFTTGEQATVYVPRGIQYEYCNTTSELLTGADTTERMFCERGPVAFDEEDGFISHRILACPPPECIFSGCPGHELQAKGLAGCGVDTEQAPIGTSFNLSFTVFDSSRPSASASILRTVTVISPCPASEVYCPDRAVECAATPCDLREEVLEAEPQYAPPELILDSSAVPYDALQFSEVPGAVREVQVWAVCGERPVLDFTNVCGAANQADLRRTEGMECRTRNAECVLRALPSTSSDPEPVVALVRRDESACDDDARCEVQCSLDAITTGRCPPSRQAFTMHAFHESGSLTLSESTGSQIRIQTDIVHKLAAASMVLISTLYAPAATSAHNNSVVDMTTITDLSLIHI